MKLCDVFGLGILLTLVNSTVLPAREISPGNLAHTFSIVARDAETGEMVGSANVTGLVLAPG